ncbi:MAG: hypothetical protein BroJett021_19750 [Chloroflexota bacterium]|nr:MAG: hypothetical protein BroJett021_19750 [Chloroflexota bacterium]
MAGKQQTAEVQNKRQVQPKAEPAAAEKTRDGAEVAGAWFAGLAAASGDGGMGHRIELLGNR